MTLGQIVAIIFEIFAMLPLISFLCFLLVFISWKIKQSRNLKIITIIFAITLFITEICVFSYTLGEIL